jgi:hypothetical protein
VRFVLVVLALAAAAPATAQGVAERIASATSSPGSREVRFIDAELLTLFRYVNHEYPASTGGGGRSEVRILATPLASLAESQSQESGIGRRSSFRLLPVLGARLFEREEEIRVDALTGAPLRSSRWGLLELPMLGPLIGRKRVGDETRWQFLFLGGS